MPRKISLVNAIVWGVLILAGMCVLFRFAIDISLFWEGAKEIKFYPERVPTREVITSDGFEILWFRETKDGTQYRVFTQIFAPDRENLIYITTDSINSIDYLSGDVLWSTDILEDSTFHLYDDLLFSLDSYDKTVPFAPNSDIEISSKCHSHARSTLRTYSPHTGKIVWEYSYMMVDLYQIFFKDNSAVISGVVIKGLSKNISVFEIDVSTGEILGAICQNFNSYSRISDNEGILASGFYPLSIDDEWEESTEETVFVTDGSELIMVDRQPMKSLAKVQFSGFPLNPNSVQLIIQKDILVVYLDDSNQFFAFRMK